MRLLLTIALLPVFWPSFGQKVQLDITGIKTIEGHIQVMIYQSASAYERDEPDDIKRFPKEDLRDHSLRISIELAQGMYGIIVMDDTIDSEVMEFNFLGLPKKGFGFAGYQHRGIKRPQFEEFAFRVSGQVVCKEVKLRYL